MIYLVGSHRQISVNCSGVRILDPMFSTENVGMFKLDGM
jgi:hypothetical protein